MAYKVLYRKYRPQSFNDLYGQDSIKEILKDSIINNKLAHAYCFNGPRGTGKTSTAKLFAKAINCENCKDGIPCGECPSCLNFNENPDIIEIDAASNNGVEEIRELRDNVKILPSNSKYKIYIIDEVHMLSQSAWNAFLKTLEEPPKHVIFILATTEIQKVPITVLSRCQRFTFKKIPKQVICDRLLSIAKNEDINIDNQAAEYIAELADGGMRDALGYLDQLSKEAKPITTELIQNCFGIIGDSTIEEIFKNAENGQIENITNIFNDIENQGLEVNLLISKILNYLYNEEIKILENKESVFNDIKTIKELAFDISNCYLKKDALVLIKVTILSKVNVTPKQQNNEKIISREIIKPNINVKK
ncbi:MAG: DNA polymerase III subunit gamma/tau, partial [bacterium]|nr:DNA polymerase III subunit gamma/tau [bacterium]